MYAHTHNTFDSQGVEDNHGVTEAAYELAWFIYDVFSQVILGEEVAASKLTILIICNHVYHAVQAGSGQSLINETVVWKILQSYAF